MIPNAGADDNIVGESTNHQTPGKVGRPPTLHTANIAIVEVSAAGVSKPFPCPERLPLPEQEAVEDNLHETIVNLSTRVRTEARKCLGDKDVAFECTMCRKTFKSRAQLFHHLRDVGHAAIITTAETALCTHIINGSVEESITFINRLQDSQNTDITKELVSAALPSGETPLLLACIHYVLCKSKKKEYDVYKRQQWLLLIHKLVQSGANAFHRPSVKLNHRGRNNELRTLRLWGAEASFRACAAELAWITADEALCGLLLHQVSDESIRKLSTCKFVKCSVENCPLGGIARGDFGSKQETSPVKCVSCSSMFCSTCRRKESLHRDKNGNWVSCNEALCKELVQNKIQDYMAIKIKHLSTDVPAKEIRGLKVFNDLLLKLKNLQSSAALSQATRVAVIAVLEKYRPSMVARCGICNENFGESPPVETCKYGILRVSKIMCGHKFCTICLRQWIQASLDECRTYIRCPEYKCKAQLYSDDVKRVATEDQYRKYDILLQADHRGRLLEAYRAKELEEVKLDEQSRPCPKCRVILYRISGCNDFICNCGHRFNYAAATWPTEDELVAEIERMKQPIEVAE